MQTVYLFCMHMCHDMACVTRGGLKRCDMEKYDKINDDAKIFKSKMQRMI